MIWHPEGRFLCVRAERHTKNKKSTYTNFELFRVKEKDVPVDLLEFKEKVLAFAWEPKGVRFGVVYGDGVRPDVSFYTMESGIKGVKSKVALISASALHCSALVLTLFV
jgi:translation initiation factor 3 subunit B